VKRIDLLKLLTFLVVVITLGTSSQTFAGDLSLTILYTSNTLGEMEAGCCPETGNNGGLARRAFHINEVRKEVRDLLVLDGGDALAIGLPGSRVDQEKARRRAELVLKIYEKMGYSALNIGDTDLVLGVRYLQALQKKFKIPFLSANLKSKKSMKPFFEPFLIKNMNGFRIGIIGLLTPGVPPYPAETRGESFIDDPVKVATDLIDGSMASCDHIIALAHLDPIEIESLARRVPKISVVIGGNNRAMEYPSQIDRSFYVQTDAYGFHLGRLDERLVKSQSEIAAPPPANRFILLHPEMGSDPRIEEIISRSKDRLKRPLP